MKKLPLLLTILSLPAWGYNFTKDFTNGFYWENIPVKFTVEDSNSSRKTMLQNLTKQAIEEWESRTGLTIWNFKSSGGTSNKIRWSTNFASETNMDASSVLAVTVRYQNGPYFTKSEIIINGNHPDLSGNEANILTTLTHELGHTIGLDHSDDWTAVMAPTLQNPYYGLASDDVNGMADLYQTTVDRQVSGYVSPLSNESSSESSSPLSCGTVSVASASAPAVSANGMASLGLGMLMGFLKKLVKWFKSWF